MSLERRVNALEVQMAELRAHLAVIQRIGGWIGLAASVVAVESIWKMVGGG